MESPFPFLSLPREIRDEVYSYLVLLHVPPLPPSDIKIVRGSNGDHTHVTPYPKSKPSLSILRVNRQIHWEAAEALYSRSVFHIQTTAASSIAGVRPRQYVRVYWDTPWENLVVHRNSLLREMSENFMRKPLISYYGPRNTHKTLEGIIDLEGPKRAKPLWELYRHLIRHVRIDVRDLRTCASDSSDEEEATRLLMRDSLLPFVEELREFIGGAGGKVRVNIHVESDIEGTGEGGFERRYAGLVEMVWPLMNGPWRANIIMSEGLQRRTAGGIGERVLGKYMKDLGDGGRRELKEVWGCLGVWVLRWYWTYEFGTELGFKVGGERRYEVVVTEPASM
ncbi:hypothetical protein TWF481_011850 [Arthrobotrys musiformis]|uniref:F-box domain-containing protein n=1 Tax=Arthrobotrys musiformis TaxID=47236 RepID=A0AAV9VY46_9PEZI